MEKPKTIILSTVITIISSTAQGGSFSLYTESSAAAIGDYGAGIAAEAADASIGWYNPAGLALIHNQQIVLGAAGILPRSILTGTSTYHTPSIPNYVQSFYGINGAKNAVVPSLHYAIPLGTDASFGLSIVSPFGLSTNWKASGPVRYEATDSELMTINVSPEIGGRLFEHIALGAGLDLQYADVKFNQVLGSPAYAMALSPFLGNTPATLFDSISYNKGHSFTVGFHTGVMLVFNDNHSRVGLNYQSQMKHQFHGYSRLTGTLASPNLNIANPLSILSADSHAVFQTNSLSSNNIAFPDVITLSGYQDVNDTLALLGSVVYTGWHSFHTIRLNDVAAYVSGIGQALVNSTSTEYYKDVLRVAVGANYKLNPQWMLRFGAGYDETPTINRYRDVRIADSDRIALAIGTHYQMRPNFGFDLGYSHLFSTGNVPINKTTTVGTSTYNVTARAAGSVDLVGLQVVWTDYVASPPVTTK